MITIMMIMMTVVTGNMLSVPTTIRTPAQCKVNDSEDVAVVCLGAGYAGRALLSRLNKTFKRIAPDRALTLTATCPLTALDDTREWVESSKLPVQVLNYDLGEVGK